MVRVIHAGIGFYPGDEPSSISSSTHALIANGVEIDVEQVHPAVCSASHRMHLTYLYINQVFICISLK